MPRMSTELDEPYPISPRPTQLCTPPLYRFQRRHFEIFDFMFLTTNLAVAADDVRAAAINALSNPDSDDDTRMIAYKKNPTPNFDRIFAYANYRSEVMTVFLVDNFLGFLSEVIELCSRKRPELLKSSSQISVEDALRFSTKKELVDFIINRQINELSYGGIFAIEDFLMSRTKISFSDDEIARSRLNFATELRNVYVHSRGVINELFMSRVKSTDHGFSPVLGQRFHANFDALCILANNLILIANDLDSKLAKKFNLQRKKYSTWDVERKDRLARSLEKLKNDSNTED